MNWHIFQWRLLQTRVTLYTLVIFLLGIWSLALYASRTLQEEMQLLLGQQQFSTVALMADQIDDQLKARMDALETIAAGIDPSVLASRQALQTLLEQLPIFQGLFNAGTFVTGIDGVAIAAFPATSGQLGVNFMDRDYITSALKEGKGSIGRPVRGKVMGHPVFSMATPIHDAQGKVIGVVAGVIDLSKPNFLDHLTSSQYGKTGGYVLVAPAQRLIVTSSDKRVMETLPGPGANEQIDRYLQGSEGASILVNPMGVKLLTAVKGIPTAHWYAAVYLPTTEAFAPIRETQRRMLMATLLLTLLTGGLIRWVLKKQLTPLQTAAQTLATLSDRNQPLRSLPVTRQDEIGQLIGGFNRLLLDLGQREEQYRAVTDNGQALIWMAGLDRGRCYFNQPWLSFTGRSMSQESGNGWTEGVHADDLKRCLDIYVTAFDRREKFSLLYRMRNHSGEYRWLLDDGAPRYDSDQNFLGYVGHCLDITTRKQAEDALRESEERYRTAFQTSPDAVNINRLVDGVFLDVNDGFSRLVGWTREEVLGRTSLEINVWRNVEDRHRLVQALLRDGFCENMEVDFVARDGKAIRALMSARVLTRDAEQCILSVTRDMTEKMRLSEQARMVERHLAKVVESASDLVISTDSQGCITSWNGAAQRITGYRADEVRGQMLGELCERSQRKDMTAIIGQLADASAAESLSEINLMARSGALIPVDWSFSVIRDDAGLVRGIVAVGRDLLERRVLEQHLYQSEKLAALGVLASGIAHELRNPLAVSFSAAQFLLDKADDPAFERQCVQKILEGIERSSAIIENLLRFARPSSSNRTESLDLVSIVRDTLSVLTPQAKLKNISLIESYHEPTLPISGNVNLLQQVVMNLVLNAFQAIQDGGKVSVSTRREDDQVLLHVRDTGCGISPAHLNRIFDPFFTTRAVEQGTGLGLSICHTIIKQHGGSVAVESSVEGQGTTFVVRLPLLL